MKDQVIARETEVPHEECPLARLPLPIADSEAQGKAKVVPEGAPHDNWVDDSYWLNVAPPEQQRTDPNMPPQLLDEPARPRRSPRRRAKPQPPSSPNRKSRPKRNQGES